MKINTKLRYGGYALLVTLFGIALIILLNIGLSAMDQKFDLKIDTTQNKKYSLSDTTKKTVAALTKDVRIYTLYVEGSENADVVEIINKFKGLSGHVTVENVDPERNPGFVKKFQKEGETIAAGSIIVTDAENKLVRILDQYAQFEYGYDEASQRNYIAQIKVEGAVANAMNYIELGYMPSAYVVQGHGELTIGNLGNINAFMSDQNYNLESVNIAQTPDKIKAGDIIMFFNPQSDISDEERDLLKPLMEKGGRFYFLFDPLKTNAEKMPNLMSLLKLYDISLKKGLVVETNLGNMYSSQYPSVLVPIIQTHEVTKGVGGGSVPVIMPNSGALDLPDVAPESSMTITALLKSSKDAYLKVVDETTTNEDMEQKPEDETGEFTLMAAVEKTVGTDAADSVRFIVSYNTEFATTSNLNNFSSNMNLFMDSASWMRNAEKDIYVRPKTVADSVMRISNAFEFWMILAVSILLVPVLMLIAGIVVHVRRKHL